MPDESLDEKKTIHAGIVTRNQDKFRALQMQGAQPEPSAILIARLNVLLDNFLSEEDRLDFEILFETRMTALLDEMISQATQYNIMRDVKSPNEHGLILP